MNKFKAFTLVEMLIALVIASIITLGATVGMNNIIVQQRLEGAANKIFADLRLAQSEALKSNKTVYISFKTGNDSWCYGKSFKAACDCKTANSCQLDGVSTVVDNQNYPGIALQSANFAGRTQYTAFDPKRGFAQAGSVKNGTVWLASTNDQQLAVVLNRLGRIRFCSPTLSKYSKQCPDAPKL